MLENFFSAEMVNLSLTVTFDEINWNFSSGGGSGNGGGGGGGSLPTTDNSLTVNHNFSLYVAQPLARLESTTETAARGFAFTVADVIVTPSVAHAEICFSAPTGDIWDTEAVRFDTGANSVRGRATWQGYDNQGRQCIEMLFPVTEPIDGAIEIGSMTTYPAYNDADAAIARDVLESFGFASFGVSATEDPLNPNKPAILSFSYGATAPDRAGTGGG